MPIYDARQISGPASFFRFQFADMPQFDPARRSMARADREVADFAEDVARRRRASIAAATPAQRKRLSETRAWNEAKAKLRRLGIEEPQEPEEPDLPEADGVGIAELEGPEVEAARAERQRLERQYLEQVDRYNRESHVYEQALRDMATQLRRPGVTLTDEQAKQILEQSRRKVLGSARPPAGSVERPQDLPERERMIRSLPPAPEVTREQAGWPAEGPPTGEAAPAPGPAPGQPGPAGGAQPARAPTVRPEALQRAAQVAREAGVGAPEEQAEPRPAAEVTGPNPVRELRQSRGTAKKLRLRPSKAGPLTGRAQAPDDPGQVFTALTEGQMDPQEVEQRPRMVDRIVEELERSPKMRKQFERTAAAVREEIARETGLDPRGPMSRGDRDRMAMGILDRLTEVYPERVVTAAWKQQIRDQIKKAKGPAKEELKTQMAMIREAESIIEERRRTRLPESADDLARIVAPEPSWDEAMAEAEDREFTMAVPGIEYRRRIEDPAKVAEGIMAMRRKLVKDRRDEVRGLVREAKAGDSAAQHRVLGLMLGPDSPVRQRYEELDLPGGFPTLPIVNQITGGIQNLVSGGKQERKEAAMRLYAYATRLDAFAGGYGMVGQEERQQVTAGLPSLQPLVGALRVAGVRVPDLSAAERRVALKRFGDEMDRYLEQIANRRSP